MAITVQRVAGAMRRGGFTAWKPDESITGYKVVNQLAGAVKVEHRSGRYDPQKPTELGEIVAAVARYWEHLKRLGFAAEVIIPRDENAWPYILCTGVIEPATAPEEEPHG